MARLYPFRALRYDTSRVNMADVVTQPYDKISPEMQARYYAKSPYNLIRVVLGKREPSDSETDNVYTRAAASLSAWRAEGVLQQEAEPALYGYSQTYIVPGTALQQERRGFIALGQLYDYAEQVVYRHEQTFPKHKSDRLALFKAIRAYPEQIYMLYSDPTFTAEHLIFDLPSGEPRTADLEIQDEYGVLHRVWQLTDPTLIGRVLEVMQDKKLIIADGHHRYETSVAYMHERAAQLGLAAATGDNDTALTDSFNDLAPRTEPSTLPPDAPVSSGGGLPQPAFPEAAMMMTFVNMDAPGITILPTHRVVFGLDHFSGQRFAEEAAGLFDVQDLNPPGKGGALADETSLLQRLHDTPGVAFIAATREGTYLLTPKPEAVAQATAGLSERQRQLDVVQLHRLVLDGLLGLNEDTVRAGSHVHYVRKAQEALDQVQRGEADVAFLIKPVTLGQMKDISLNLEVMPQKSTDFYPKLLSGLAMYALD